MQVTNLDSNKKSDMQMFAAWFEKRLFILGQLLCGALDDGKIFLWEKDKDKVQFITGLPKIFNDVDKGNWCFFCLNLFKF